MTLKLAKRLQERQAGKISSNSLKKVFLARRVNSRLVESILLNNTNEKVLGEVCDFLVERVAAKDKRALNVLLRTSDESLNKNVGSRWYAVDGLWRLAENGELGVLPSLLKAGNDSNLSVWLHAVEGLKHFAKLGNLQAQKKLIQFKQKW